MESIGSMSVWGESRSALEDTKILATKSSRVSNRLGDKKLPEAFRRSICLRVGDQLVAIKPGLG